MQPDHQKTVFVVDNTGIKSIFRSVMYHNIYPCARKNFPARCALASRQNSPVKLTYKKSKRNPGQQSQANPAISTVPVKKFSKQHFFVAIRYLYCYITGGYSPISNFPWPHVARHGASLFIDHMHSNYFMNNLRRELQLKMQRRIHAYENQTS